MDNQLKTISELKKNKFRERLICAALTGLTFPNEPKVKGEVTLLAHDIAATEAIKYADAVLKILEEEDAP